MKVKDITLTALLAAMICIFSPWSLPIGPVPLTLVTFSVYLAASVIDWKYGCTAVAVYILLGAVGLPVFSGFRGGFQVLLGAAGGYIIGYIPCALITGILISRYESKKWMYPAAMVLGTLACYLLGTIWFMYVMKSNLLAALLVCVLPFLIGDAVKIAAASVLAIRLRPILAGNKQEPPEY